ncbi:hypothetical protein BDQ17DRAFT_1306479 [Cyathus striatus]|nr:hypothetical protein BDQ17DRAFT_1306479 [Cyathus striatus]
MLPAKQQTLLPLIFYQVFYLYIEPISALVGAYYAAFRPDEYLALLSPSISKVPMEQVVSSEAKICLLQLANLYLLFALNEHLVLSSTSSIKTWRRLLVGLLVADIGHLVSMAPLGSGIYWRIWEWNAMAWGSVGFVYLGAASRITFLAGTNNRRD